MDNLPSNQDALANSFRNLRLKLENISLFPKELITTILRFCHFPDEVMSLKIKEDFPLWRTSPLQSQFSKNCYENYKSIRIGQIPTRVQVLDRSQVSKKNADARSSLKFNQLRFGTNPLAYNATVSEYIRCSPSLLSNNDPLDDCYVRPLPLNIRHMKSPFQIFIPPTKTWSEYFYEGEEIELQWGAGYFWWRGVVEKIDDVQLHLIFTQWDETSQYYRELALFGTSNQSCCGVRKLTREEKLFWRERMKEESYNLWPRDWDEKKIETYALKNETECFIDPESYELVNYHVVPHVKNLNPIQESLPNFNFPPLEIYVSSEINHENDEPPRFDFGL